METKNGNAAKKAEKKRKQHGTGEKQKGNTNEIEESNHLFN